MEIRMSSVYDADAIRSFYLLNMYKDKNPKKQFQKTFLAAMGLIVLAILGIVISDHSFFDLLMYISIGIAIIMLLSNCFLYIWAPKRVYKKQYEYKKRPINVDFIFYDDEFESTSAGEGISVTRKVKYSALVKITECKKYFILYENSSSAYILNKRTINSDDMYALKSKFRAIVPLDKYITLNDW